MINDPEFLTRKNQWLRIFLELGIPCSTEFYPNPEGAERILVLCRGGNTRSVAVAMLLKYKYFKNALTASLEKNDAGTIRMLYDWCSYVILTEDSHRAEFFKLVPEATQEACNPTVMLDLGTHRRLVTHPYDLELLKEIDVKLQEMFKNGKP